MAEVVELPQKGALRFKNRSHAGRRLARRLDHLRYQPTVVLGLPRGGIPVGFEVARRLSAPLEALLVRKLGAPLTWGCLSGFTGR